MVGHRQIPDRPGNQQLSGRPAIAADLLDFDRDAVAIDQHHAAGDGRLLRGS